MLSELFIIIFLISIPGLIISIVKPSAFEVYRKPVPPKKNLILGFIAIMIFSVYMVNKFSSPTENKEQAPAQQNEQSVSQPTDETKKTEETKTSAPAVSPKSDTASDNTLAYKLASLQSFSSDGKAIPPQELVEKFDAYLNSLVKKCKEKDKTKISDYVVFAQQKLKEEGKYLQLLQIIAGIDASIPNEAKGLVSCAEISAAFVVLTISQ